MNLFNKKTYLLLMICFAFISMNAQQSDNNDKPLPADHQLQKNTYVADPAHSDNEDVLPEGYVSKYTYVADSTNLEGDDGAQNAKKEQATPAETKITEHDEAVIAPKMRHDGTDGSQPIATIAREKKEVVTTPKVEHNRDGSVHKAGDPIQPEPVRIKSNKAKTAKVEANEDGSAKVKKEEN